VRALKVLIACETSGIVRNAFQRHGHDAWSCDILPSDDGSNWHIQDDVRNVLQAEDWNFLVVAHPPCTRLCNSGVQHLKNVPEQKGKGLSLREWQRIVLPELQEGAALLAHLWNADIPFIAVENPIMHKYGKTRVQRKSEKVFPWKATQTVQPWEFGIDPDGPDNIKKRTCLWLDNLPKLKTTGTLDGLTARSSIHTAAPGPDRWKRRSRFFPGLADAMANQWGEHALKIINQNSEEE